MKMKICSSCKVEKAIHEFSASPSYKDGHRGQCKKCLLAHQREYRKRIGYRPARIPSDKPRKKYKLSPEKKRAKSLMEKYNLELSKFEEMRDAQGNKCAICGIDAENALRKILFVDHCHASGRIRGLLCNSCNRGIGFMRENITILSTAIRYLSAS